MLLFLEETLEALSIFQRFVQDIYERKKFLLTLIIFNFLSLWTLKGPKRRRFDAQKGHCFGAQNGEFRV
jgi:hypothetical protein